MFDDCGSVYPLVALKIKSYIYSLPAKSGWSVITKKVNDMRALPRRSRKETGEASTEYALLIVLIGLLVVGAIRLIGSATSSQLKKTGDTVSGSPSSGGGSGAASGTASGSAGSGSSSGSGGNGAAGSAGSGGSGGTAGSGGTSGGAGGTVGNPPVVVH
jgi:Flp pilus assembly pilin Flp